MNDNIKPRIAILHYAAPPTIGGVESTIAVHARLFADHGYSVKIIAGRGEQFDPRVPVVIIPTVDSRHPDVAQVNGKLSGDVQGEFNTLTADIRRTLGDALANIDVCIAHNILTLHKNLALTTALHEIAQQHNPHLIAWCHDMAWSDPVYAGDMHKGLPWDLLRQAWNGVKYVAVSETRRAELATLLDISPADISVVPPGIDACEFLGITPTAADWWHTLNLDQAMPLLLLPARVTRRKNIELAIEITAALRKRGLTPKLVVMGPLGPHNPANKIYFNELRQLRKTLGVENDVLFLQEFGAIDDSTRRDLYLLADALVFPSEREGFGIPILEAGISRLPIFCADIAPFHESARESAHYFALDESSDKIAAQIAGELERDPRYQLKKRVLQEYDWEQIFHRRIEPLVTGSE